MGESLMNELGNQFGSGIVIAYFVEYLKNASWFPWLKNEDSEFYKKTFGAVFALFTSIGITYSFDYDPNSGGHIVFGLPNLHVLLDFAKQWAFQQFAYDTAVKGK
jgi:hypothetical protein